MNDTIKKWLIGGMLVASFGATFRSELKDMFLCEVRPETVVAPNAGVIERVRQIPQPSGSHVQMIAAANVEQRAVAEVMAMKKAAASGEQPVTLSEPKVAGNVLIWGYPIETGNYNGMNIRAYGKNVRVEVRNDRTGFQIAVDGSTPTPEEWRGYMGFASSYMGAIVPSVVMVK